MNSSATSWERTRRKVAWRILPFLFLLYLVAFLDRANVSFARNSMKDSLGFTDADFGFGAGIFFIGYILLEIPGALLAERWSARKWLARILISWGICCTAIGAIQTATHFHVARFFLGLAEAGFFPAVIVYLSHWFPARDRARAMSGFILGIPVALMIGGPFSSALMKVSWLGIEGWRWMFILEGVPAVVLGIITLFYLHDYPRQASWLSPSEKEALESHLAEEKKQKGDRARLSIWQALRNRNTLVLASALFFVVITTYGYLFWLPSTITEASQGQKDGNLFSFIPYSAALIAVVAVGWSSDWRRERKWHTAIPMLAGAFFFLASTWTSSFAARLVLLSLTGACLYAWGPSFWALPTLILGESGAAASVGLINMIGNVGGFVGPVIVGRLLDGGIPYNEIILLLSGSFFLAGVLISFLKIKE